MDKRKSLKTIMDREKLHTMSQCPACGRNFTMGETVVLACGGWEGGPKLVHENDAVFDEATDSYVERRCYEGRKNP